LEPSPDAGARRAALAVTRARAFIAGDMRHDRHVRVTRTRAFIANDMRRDRHVPVTSARAFKVDGFATPVTRDGAVAGASWRRERSAPAI